MCIRDRVYSTPDGITPQLVKDSSDSDLASHAGKQKVQLDFQLCCAEYRARCQVAVPGQQFYKIQHTALLLELVYFFWFEERQLARGAKMLAKVISLASLLQGPRAASDRQRHKLDSHHDHLDVCCTNCHKQLSQSCEPCMLLQSVCAAAGS